MKCNNIKKSISKDKFNRVYSMHDTIVMIKVSCVLGITPLSGVDALAEAKLCLWHNGYIYYVTEVPDEYKNGELYYREQYFRELCDSVNKMQMNGWVVLDIALTRGKLRKYTRKHFELV